MRFKHLLLTLVFGVHTGGAIIAAERTLAMAATGDPVLTALLAEVQPLSPGALLIASGDWHEAIARQQPEGLCQVVAVQDQPFTTALEIRVAPGFGNYWERHFKLRNDSAIKAGEVVHYSFWARTLVGGATGRLKFNVNSSDAQHWGPDVCFPDTWTRQLLTWTAPEDIPAGKFELMFSFAFPDNLGLQLAGFTAVTFPVGTDPNRLPIVRPVTSYPGQAKDAPWRNQALDRIAQQRTGDVHVSVVDVAGQPVPKAMVTATLARHAFPFGTVESWPCFPGVTVQPFGYWGPEAARLTDADRTAVLQKILETCSAVVAAPNWYCFGANRELDPQDFQAVMRWCTEHRLHILGNDIVYRDQYWPDEAKALLEAGDKDGLQRKIASFLRDYATLYPELETATLTNEWDLNSMRLLYRTEQDPHGWSAALPWFTTMRQAAPHLRLGLNETGPGPELKERLQWLQQHGVQIDWVGFQLHQTIPGIAPEKLLKIFDEYAALGVKIEITEADFAIPDGNDPAQLQWQRDYLRDFYIACLSHPAVTGVVKWGIWEKTIWDSMRGKHTAYFNEDWSWTNLGGAYRDLVLGQWKSVISSPTGSDGACGGKGFQGTYTVTVRAADGRTGQAEIVVPAAGAQVTVTVR